MHELHLAQDILRKIHEQAGKLGKGEEARITHAKIGLGQSRFTHLEELLELFADISGGIKLEIEVIPVKTACAKCKTEFNPKTMRLDCEQCGSTDIQMVSGNELVIKELR
jgi:Zn finger protein HypA/HybF involved in hydrogenase expression